MSHAADEPFERAVTALKLSLGPRSLVTIDDMRAQIAASQGHCLTTPRSVIYVTIEDYERSGERVAQVGPAAGDLDEIMEALPHMEAWARAEGCTQVQVHGRRGWVRALTASGYEEHATIVRKLLD
jgi:hypothetical protein